MAAAQFTSRNVFEFSNQMLTSSRGIDEENTDFLTVIVQASKIKALLFKAIARTQEGDP